MTDAPATRFEPIAISSESTVVAEFVPDSATSVAYQSEAELEREFIRLLQGQAYEYVTIRPEAKLLEIFARATRGTQRRDVHR
jgi:type I restriction enzyme R subunit